MSPEVALYIAIASMLLTIPGAVYSVYVHITTRGTTDAQAKAIEVYSTAFEEIAKLTQEAMLPGEDLDDYKRGCRALAYEVFWELENCNKALRSETESAP